jgi:hypothetical protein
MPRLRLGELTCGCAPSSSSLGLDITAATNTAARYDRVRLVP